MNYGNGERALAGDNLLDSMAKFVYARSEIRVRLGRGLVLGKRVSQARLAEPELKKFTVNLDWDRTRARGLDTGKPILEVDCHRLVGLQTVSRLTKW